jgi:hypothetical protein
MIKLANNAEKESISNLQSSRVDLQSRDGFTRVFTTWTELSGAFSDTLRTFILLELEGDWIGRTKARSKEPILLDPASSHPILTDDELRLGWRCLAFLVLVE